MASRLRVRHALSLAVSALRWCSAAAASRARGAAWRETHGAGVGHGGPLRMVCMRVEFEVFRRIGEDIICHLVEVRGVIQLLRIHRGMETEPVRPGGIIAITYGRCGPRADGGLRGNWHRGGDEGSGWCIITRVVPEIRGDNSSCSLCALSSLSLARSVVHLLGSTSDILGFWVRQRGPPVSVAT